MKKVTIIRSLRDLAALKAKELCDKDKPYYRKFLDCYEKKLVDDIVKAAIDNENCSRILPFILFIAEKNVTIPIPFEVDGMPVNKIRVNGESYDKRCEASFDGVHWIYMGARDCIRLYDALDDAGCLEKFE